MTGDQLQGLAALVVAMGSLAGTVGTLVMQLRTNKIARSNADKIDDNTKVTKETASKVDDVHAATAALVEATGSHKILTPPP